MHNSEIDHVYASATVSVFCRDGYPKALMVLKIIYPAWFLFESNLILGTVFFLRISFSSLLKKWVLEYKCLRTCTKLLFQISNLFTRVCRLPFEHLGQSNLFTRVCRFVCKSGNFLFYFRTETVSQVQGVLKIYSAFIFR